MKWNSASTCCDGPGKLLSLASGHLAATPFYPKTASVIAQLQLPKPALPEPIREAPQLRTKLEGIAPSLIATLPWLDRIDLVGEDRYRAIHGDIVVGWKFAPDGELTQFFEQADLASPSGNVVLSIDSGPENAGGPLVDRPSVEVVERHQVRAWRTGTRSQRLSDCSGAP